MSESGQEDGPPDDRLRGSNVGRRITAHASSRNILRINREIVRGEFGLKYGLFM